MLIGSVEHLEQQKRSQRIKTAYDYDLEREGIKDIVWVNGKYINIIDSHKLMRHIKEVTHDKVLDLIKKNSIQADNFFKQHPDKKPDDYYILIKHDHAILDHETAKNLVKYFTGEVPDFDFIEKEE